MDYLSLAAMRELAPELRSAVDELIAEPAFTAKRGARQWQFLRDLLDRMLAPGQASPFDTCDRAQAAQLKFEVADRVRRYYLRPGKPVRFLFALAHRSALPEDLRAEDWPELLGYRLLVRDVSEAGTAAPWDPGGLRSYLERVVAEACCAEFQVYQALPELRFAGLEPWFVQDGPAKLEIQDMVIRQQPKGWTLTTPLNPSTYRLLETKVHSMEPGEAMVATKEYWYLCWQDPRTLERAYTYRETNRQFYILRPEDGTWKVFQNLRPMPRSVAPHRKVKRS
jgi:hypothetical protein